MKGTKKKHCNHSKRQKESMCEVNYGFSEFINDWIKRIVRTSSFDSKDWTQMCDCCGNPMLHFSFSIYKRLAGT